MDLDRKYRFNLLMIENAELNLRVIHELVVPLQEEILLPLLHDRRQNISDAATEALSEAIDLCIFMAGNEMRIFDTLAEAVQKQISPVTVKTGNQKEEAAKVDILSKKWEMLYDEAYKLKENQEKLQGQMKTQGIDCKMPDVSEILSYVDCLENMKLASGHLYDSYYYRLSECLQMILCMM